MMRAITNLLTIIGIAALLAGPVTAANETDWVERGLRLIGRQRYDEAIQAFSNAIEVIPRDFQAYNYRGIARALKGDFERAVADYNKALEIRPHYAEAFNNRGFANTQRGNLQRALDDYTRALEIDPFFVDAYNNKAWILATAADKSYRNSAAAIMLAQKSLELDPDVASLDTLAAAYAAAGNFESAIETQKKAIQKLLLANQAAEVPPYMKRLKSYRARQSLLIDYSAARADSGGRDLKASLKTKTKNKSAPMPDKEKKAPGPQTAEAGPAPETKRFSAPAADLPYTIQISAFRDPQKSNQVAKRLRIKGDRAFTCPVRISGKGKWHRVYIGYYRTYEEARVAADGLKKRHFRYVHVTKKPYAVQVGLAGSEEEVQMLKSRLQAKGYLPYSLPAGGGQRQTRILIGAYKGKKTAATLMNQLQKDGFKAEIGLR